MSVVKKSVVNMSVVKISALLVAKRTVEYLRRVTIRRPSEAAKPDWLFFFF